MFQALTVSDLRAIADAAAAVMHDDKAMQEYLHPGSTSDDSLGPPIDVSELDREAKAGRFDSPERAHFKELTCALLPEARRELIAIIDVGRDTASDFADGYEQAGDCPEEHQAEYIRSRAYLYLSMGLEKLKIVI
jgi:hypothetical protein